MFGTISFVTNAAGSILQLLCSVYGLFDFPAAPVRGKQEEGAGCSGAMAGAVKQSVGSVLSSGLTTSADLWLWC